MPWAFTMASLSNPDPEEGMLELSAGGGQVDRVGRGTLERPFRLAPRLLGPLEVDLTGHVGRLGHDHDLVRPNLQEAAGDGEELFLATTPNAQLPEPERRQQRRMVRQHPELPLNTRTHNRINLVTKDLSFWCDYF